MSASTSPVATSPETGSKSVVLEAQDANVRISPLTVGSWALYDFANTIFSLNVISTYFPLYIVELGYRDADYAFPMSLATLLVAIVMPLLGSLSDQGGKRMPWL